MLRTNLLNRTYSSSTTSLANQILAAIVQNRPFDAQSPPPSQPWSTESVSQVLRSIPINFFQSPRSIGRQTTFRHRSPLNRRNLREESRNLLENVRPKGPAAFRDPEKVNLGLDKALEFFHWVESRFQFDHNEMTCREMAVVLAKGNRITKLWDFLKEMHDRQTGLVTVSTVTCLIKVLGEEGLINEAFAGFLRMKRFRCKPDVVTYNTIIHALCRVRRFKKARFLLRKMESPRSRCPRPDTYTYTILISSYCKYAMQTGDRTAIKRSIWEANHLFRIMIFNKFSPDVVTYNCLIDGCCKTNRIDRAVELFDDMGKKGCVPNRVTYNSLIRYYSVVNEIDKAIEMLRRMQSMKHGVAGSSSYTPIIHGLCEAGRVLEARDFLGELVDGGLVPREYTYRLVCEALDKVGESRLLSDGLRSKIEEGIGRRFKEVMKVKPLMRV